jgi:hypothetical protein
MNRGWANPAAGDPTRRRHLRTFAATSPCLTYLARDDLCLLRVWEKATETPRRDLNQCVLPSKKDYEGNKQGRLAGQAIYLVGLLSTVYLLDLSSGF